MSQYAFRRLRRPDFPLLAGWLAQPHVHRFWNHDPSPEAVERDFGTAADDLEPAEDWLIVADGVPIGLIQFCLIADYPAYLAELAAVVEVPAGAGTIDYLIGEPFQIGRGVGTAAVQAFMAHLWAQHPMLPGLLVAVVATNPASWKMLQRCGFTVVGTGDLTPDNEIDPPEHHVLWAGRP